MYILYVDNRYFILQKTVDERNVEIKNAVKETNRIQ